MEAKRLNNLSIEKYKAMEGEGDVKYEYHDGFVHAMAGDSFNHGLISGNFFAEVGTKLLTKKSSCFPLNSDIKLHIATENRFLYPDVMVVCADVERSDLDAEAVTNPILVVEVLSKTTASYDRGDKFYFYRQISGLLEYVLIEQDKAQIEIYKRNEANLWRITRIMGINEKLHLSSLDIELEMNAIYRNVEFVDEP